MKWVTERIVCVGTGGGKVSEGKVARCSTCNGDAWILFRVPNLDHAHCQCVRCGAVCCSDPERCQKQVIVNVVEIEDLT